MATNPALESLQNFTKSKKAAATIAPTSDTINPALESLKGFVSKKLPAVVSSQATPAQTTPEKKTLFQKAGDIANTASDFVIGGLKSTAENVTKDVILATGGQKKIDEITRQYNDNGDKMTELAGKQTNLTLKKKYLQMAKDNYDSASKVKGDIIGNVKTVKQQLADAALAALDVATLGGVGVVGKTIAKGAGKALLKGAGEEIIKQTAKKSAGQIAKTTLADAALGGTYGVLMTASEKEDATPEDYLKSGAIGAGIGVVAPYALGAATKGIFKGSKALTEGVGDLVEKSATKLEKIADKEGGKISDESARFLQKASEKSQTKVQKVAEVGANVLRSAQKIPGKAKTVLLDRYYAVDKLTRDLSDKGINTGDLKDMIDRHKYVAEGQAEKDLRDSYVPMIEKYGDDWDKVKEYSGYLDRLDRIANDRQIEGGKTVEDVKKAIAEMQSSMTPEQIEKVKAGQKELQGYFDNQLQKAVDSGRLSKEDYNRIKAAHPNYTPHDVLDFLDDEGASIVKRKASGISTTKSGVNKAKGSQREVDDIDRAVVRGTLAQNTASERNKTASSIIDAVEKGGEEFGRPLRKSEDVMERGEMYSEAKGLKPFKDKVSKEVDKNSSAYRKLQKEINKLEKQGLKTSLATPEKEKPKQLFSSLKTNKKGELELFTPSTTKTGEQSTKKFIESLISDPNKDVQAIKRKVATRENKLAPLFDKIDQLKKEYQDISEYRKGLIARGRELSDEEIKQVDIPKGFAIVSRFKNGVRENWLVKKDIADAMKNMTSDSASVIGNWFNNTPWGQAIQAPAKFLRATSTSLNPVFALVRNPARDAQTAIITAGNDYTKGLIQTITGHNDPELYNLARSSGALQGNIFRETSDAQKVLNEMIDKKEKAGIIKTLSNPLKLVETWGQKAEEFTRMNVFKGALANGKSVQESAKIARNASVDFGKSGLWIQQANKLIPFLNARIQGFNNLGKAISENPTETMRALMWTAAYPQAVLTSYNSQYKSYQNIPDSEKRKYWIVMVGENKGRDYNGKQVMTPHYIKIPKGEAQQAVSNVVERVLTLSSQKYPDSTSEFMLKLIGDVSPVTDSSVWPPLTQRAIELKTNSSLFRDKQIEGDYTQVGNKWYKTEEVEPKYRINTSTSEFAKQIGSVLNWSPVKIDYAIKTGLISELIDAYDLLPWYQTTREKKLEDKKTLFEKASGLPFVQGIIGTQNYGQVQAKKNYESEKAKAKTTKKIKSYYERQ